MSSDLARLERWADDRALSAGAWVLAPGAASGVGPTHTLGGAAVAILGSAAPPTATPTLRRLLLSESVGAVCHLGSPFGRAAPLRGFVGAAERVFDELLGAEVTAADLRRAAADGAMCGASRILSLADLLDDYLGRLRDAGLIDPAQLVSLAADAVEAGAGLVTPQLIVRGFPAPSGSVLRLLGAMARRGRQCAILLPWDRSRPELFAPCAGLESRIDGALARLNVDAATPAASRDSQLDRLRSALGGSERIDLPDDGTLVFADVPNTYAEAEWVAKSLHAEKRRTGAEWGDLALVTPTGDADGAFRQVFDRLGVPLGAGRGASLSDAPIVRGLLAFIQAATGDWSRDAVMAWLRSSSSPLEPVAADRVRSAASALAVRTGAAGWRRVVAHLGGASTPAGAVLEAALEMGHGLSLVARSAGGHREALGELLRTCRVVRPVTGDDRAAIGALRDVADALVDAASLRGHSEISFADFFGRLVTAAAEAPGVGRAGGDRLSVRGPGWHSGPRPVALVATGLHEGVMPARRGEDPFLRDLDRLTLRKLGPYLATSVEQADAGRFALYCSIASARERLCLTASRSRGDGEAVRSFFLQDLLRQAPGCTVDFVALESGQAGSDAGATGNGAPPTRLQGAVLDEYARPRAYSVTELEAYQTCPLRHCVLYGMRVAEEALPAGPAEKGSALHEALRRLRATAGEPSVVAEELARALDEHMARRPADADDARKGLMRAAVRRGLDAVARREPIYSAQTGMRPEHFELAFGPQSEEAGEVQRDPQSVTEPYRAEGPDGNAVSIAGVIDRVDRDPETGRASIIDYKLGATPDPNALRSGESLQLPVYMDALRRIWGWDPVAACYDSPVDDGRRRVYRQDTPNGRRWGHIAGAEDGRLAKPLTEMQFDEMVCAARTAAATAAAGIRSADVTPRPGKHCRNCPCGDLCRMAPDGAYDAPERIAMGEEQGD